MAWRAGATVLMSRARSRRALSRHCKAVVAARPPASLNQAAWFSWTGLRHQAASCSWRRQAGIRFRQYLNSVNCHLEHRGGRQVQPAWMRPVLPFAIDTAVNLTADGNPASQYRFPSSRRSAGGQATPMLLPIAMGSIICHDQAAKAPMRRHSRTQEAVPGAVGAGAPSGTARACSTREPWPLGPGFAAITASRRGSAPIARRQPTGADGVVDFRPLPVANRPATTQRPVSGLLVDLPAASNDGRSRSLAERRDRGCVAAAGETARATNAPAGQCRHAPHATLPPSSPASAH